MPPENKPRRDDPLQGAPTPIPKRATRPRSVIGITTLAGVGIELGGVVVVFCFLGWWLDRKFGTSGPWFLLAGGFLGIVGGLYKLWRQGKRFFD